MTENDDQALRVRMVEEQLQGRGIFAQRVLTTRCEVPRLLFVPEAYQAQVYLEFIPQSFCGG